MSDLQLTQGRKRGRNELRLPTLHFIVADDWIDKLGEKSFALWLKLYTLADRRHTKNNADDVVPTSQTKLVKKLGMSKATFLRQVKPLYEYGLIDYIEYADSTNEGQKPVNIVVYEYPLGEIVRAIEPLEKVRDWEDRINDNFEHAKKGGRPKKEDKPEEAQQPEVQQQEVQQQEELTQPEQPEEKQINTTNLKEATKVELVSGGVPATVIHAFDAHFDNLVANKVDIGSLSKWLVKSKAEVAASDMVLVIEQLSSYPDAIHSTLGFITSTLAKADIIRKAKANASQRKSAELRQATTTSVNDYVPTVPFYNWLDDENSETTTPEENDDLVSRWFNR